MKDFRIVSAKVLLPIYGIAPVRQFQPPSLLVVGQNLDRTEEVQFNGIQATEFFIVNSQRLLLRIPDSQVGKSLKELRILTSVALSRMDAVLSFALPKPCKFIEGIDRLVQSFVLVLLTTPGSDIFDPSSGGGARSIIGRPTGKTGASAAADLAQAIDRTRSELLRRQANNSKVPPSERLLSANLAGISFDVSQTALVARVELTSMLGSSAEVSLR